MAMINVNAVVNNGNPVSVIVGPVAQFNVTMDVVSVVSQTAEGIRIIEDGDDVVLQVYKNGDWVTLERHTI